ncbi:hypothetical protein GCM10020366_44890 [Saccharopolyspora gregorii]|uniref:Peptidase S8/S53 domain-containing protein n=1 Tax=Saccharopolyspora gregorii TaxID=33914 RepID=A0ABP6RUX2_9PSEU
MASEANTGSASRFGNSVCDNRSLRNGRPTSRRFVAVASLDTGMSVSAPLARAAGPARGAGLPAPGRVTGAVGLGYRAHAESGGSPSASVRQPRSHLAGYRHAGAAVGRRAADRP